MAVSIIWSGNSPSGPVRVVKETIDETVTYTLEKNISADAMGVQKWDSVNLGVDAAFIQAAVDGLDE